MNLLLKRQNGAFIDRITLSADATVNDLKNEFYNRYHFYPQRQQWNLNSADGPCIKGNKLVECGVCNDSSLYFKDLGVQISWRLVFFLEYLGPLIIFPMLYYFPSLFYSARATEKCQVQE
ncbi:bifunctional 3-oxo-5-alpha-steroid 4-dehydrogenase-very-long-chain enoyl-CoA reductase/Ubiquitin-like domain superfamily [Babesia duncani]|uniref:Bifunctional 3-oxo-5-alpha-steroid 4-dehydrogenase-very-long-chain enoyl-CoA reductase/Ubiquitin-like domain superfamily n=1 Tax=Babesia duncani TaxID=323732 RepID=A0AAD9PKA8_9APIC|nr:bifunctional 3-oxo-5-alpha-steroid 4-dehydrogenase-very-long-chain enoyl-CoA reductase/Ubiquitin-like domain superfamily [Babesia duncani]KAK2195992.1 bifunctional 3-oxo-5-alpha-steroid 4-dehydrogenase-very-long-chain enoyl-CoA reductase/Ubiquitin-like domain superfamily [Babesia duncani]